MTLNNFYSVANIVINKERQTCYVFLMELKYGEGRGESEKRGGGWHFSYLIFSKFIIFMIKIKFYQITLFKIVLCIWRIFFFATVKGFKKPKIDPLGLELPPFLRESPFSVYPPLSEANKKIIPLFLTAIRIGACKLFLKHFKMKVLRFVLN